MSLAYRVLGAPGQDNLLRVDIDTGTAIRRLQFDCGDRCLEALAPSEIKATDHLFFSHLHMDHVGGFDTFFRSNFERAGRSVSVWGPPGTAAILHHRFRGFWWNIVNDVPGRWIVHDVHADRVVPFRFEAAEAFARAHRLDPFAHDGAILETPDFDVEALALPHHGVSLGYVVREAPRTVVDRESLRASGLSPGPWLRRLKEGGDPLRRDDAPIEIDGVRHDASALRRTLLRESPRGSIAYLTDFLLDAATFERLVPRLAGIDTLVCEAQYHPSDAHLAERHQHATIERVAALARASGVGRLVPFHLSERYHEPTRTEMLALAQRLFPATAFPPHWGIRAGGRDDDVVERAGEQPSPATPRGG